MSLAPPHVHSTLLSRRTVRSGQVPPVADPVDAVPTTTVLPVDVVTLTVPSPATEMVAVTGADVDVPSVSVAAPVPVVPVAAPVAFTVKSHVATDRKFKGPFEAGSEVGWGTR